MLLNLISTNSLVTTRTLAEEYSRARLLEDCKSYEDLRMKWT